MRICTLESRPAAKRVGATILVYNTVVTGRDGVQVGSITWVVVSDNGVTINEAPRADKEAACGAATGTMEWSDVCANVACNAAAAEWGAAPAGCLAGWWRAMLGWP